MQPWTTPRPDAPWKRFVADIAARALQRAPEIAERAAGGWKALSSNSRSDHNLRKLRLPSPRRSHFRPKTLSHRELSEIASAPSLRGYSLSLSFSALSPVALALVAAVAAAITNATT